MTVPSEKENNRKERKNIMIHDEPEILRMSEVQLREVDRLWYPYIPFGKLTILQGDPGEGKTTLALRFDGSGDMVFKGLVLRCKTHAMSPSALRVNVSTENSSRGAVTKNEAFDRRFCIAEECAEAAQVLPMPQFTAWLSSFEQELSGTISGSCREGDIFSLAVETDYRFAAVASNVDMGDLDAVRRSYITSLREMEKITGLLSENKTLFAQRT